MIAYFPEIYEDETIFSWFGRYYSHLGYANYSNALEDLLVSRTARVDMEFSGKLNADAQSTLSEMYGMEYLMINHTMFPQYARFIDASRGKKALEGLVSGEGDIHALLPFATNKNGERHLCYCPICAGEDREKYGETYWHRNHLLRNISICAKHKCRLIETKIPISGKLSPRLYVAEDVVCDMEPEMADDNVEYGLSKYVTEIFQKPMNLGQNVPIHEFLQSKLEGTEYLSARGQQKKISKLFSDFMDFYNGLPMQGITKLHQMQKVFTGYRSNFYEICQIGYFLGISSEDMTNPILPQKSQTERFNETVAELYEAGLGCHRIARIVGSCPSTARKANVKKQKAEHEHGVRKGMQNQDWETMDNEMLPLVRKISKQIYDGNGDRPHKVTEFAVTRILGWPDKRCNYLPKCRAEIHKYQESQEMYWARESIWAYEKLRADKGNKTIYWRDLRNLTNFRKEDFISCFPYLGRFASEQTTEEIKNLI
jgi:hypothetical protein